LKRRGGESNPGTFAPCAAYQTGAHASGASPLHFETDSTTALPAEQNPGPARGKLDLTKRERCGIMLSRQHGIKGVTLLVDKKRVNVVLPEELHRKAKVKAALTGKSMAEVMREALEKWVEGDPPEEPPKKP